MTFLDRKYRQLLRLDSITCLVDAEAIFTHADNDELNRLKIRQIAYADLVVLNKTDLVTRDHLEVIHEWIGQHLDRVRIVETTRCDVPLAILLAVARFDPRHLTPRHEAAENTPHQASQQFQTWSYETDRPFDRQALVEMVRRHLPAYVYRCKGIVHLADAPTSPHALQAVGRRTELTPLDQSTQPHSRIVAIGSQIDAPALTALFAGCHPTEP